jgi:hypothetical protein
MFNGWSTPASPYGATEIRGARVGTPQRRRIPGAGTQRGSGQAAQDLKALRFFSEGTIFPMGQNCGSPFHSCYSLGNKIAGYFKKFPFETNA